MPLLFHLRQPFRVSCYEVKYTTPGQGFFSLGHAPFFSPSLLKCQTNKKHLENKKTDKTDLIFFRRFGSMGYIIGVFLGVILFFGFSTYCIFTSGSCGLPLASLFTGLPFR
jgi:hypothetical protein